MPNFEEHTKHYFNTMDDSEIENTLQQLEKFTAEVTLWMKGQDKEKAEKYEIKKYNPEDKTIQLTELKAGLLAKFKIKDSPLLNNVVFFKSSLGGLYLFSCGEFYKNDNNELIFEFKEKIYLSQQRDNYRITASTINILKLKIKDTIFSGLDVSAGGTCFVTDEETAKSYPIDEEIKDFTLSINNTKFEIPSITIAGHWPQKDENNNAIEGFVKVGIKFGDMPSEIEEPLRQHINTVARAEEVKKTLLG